MTADQEYVSPIRKRWSDVIKIHRGGSRNITTNAFCPAFFPSCGTKSSASVGKTADCSETDQIRQHGGVALIEIPDRYARNGHLRYTIGFCSLLSHDERKNTPTTTIFARSFYRSDKRRATIFSRREEAIVFEKLLSYVWLALSLISSSCYLLSSLLS